MNIAIIGSGIAGLMAASELHSKGCTVTIYEKNNSVGGHVRTVKVPIEGDQELLVEMGVIMHDPKNIHPVMNQYVKKMGLRIAEFPLTFTFENQKDLLYWTTQSKFSGFFRELAVIADAVKNSIGKGKFTENLSFFRELHRYGEMMPRIRYEKQYQHMSLSEFIEQEGFSQHFLENWFIPQVLCWWGVTKEYAKQTSIQVFTDSFYLVSQVPQYYFVDGWEFFLEKITEPFKNRIRTKSSVDTVLRESDGVVVTCGEVQERYDAVVFATPPSVVSELLQEKSDQEKEIFNRFLTITTTVYLHRDPSWMPQEEEWSSVNLLQDEKGSYSTYWGGVLHSSKPDVFLTWGDGLETTPEASKMIASADWHRTLPTVDYTYACHDIRKVQGNGQVWYCGAHVDALDPNNEGVVPSVWHENAFRSGLAVAEVVHNQRSVGWKNKLTI